ncbi:MAG: class II aldolase/adducin family protein [Anaerolineae bacterium]
MTEQELREQICLIGQLMHRGHYIDGKAGNISARLDQKRILITPSGLAKGFMSPEQLLIVDLEGTPIEGASNQTSMRPSTELRMHLECYRQRPDVGGVVHAHPVTAIALTIAGLNFTECLIPESVVLLGAVPILAYATPGSDENLEVVGKAIQDNDVLMLSHHGSLTVAKTVWDAYLLLETLEHDACIISKVQELGGVKVILDSSHIEKLLAVRERLGLLKFGDREIFLKTKVN